MGGAQRDDVEPISIIDNVTSPTSSSVHDAISIHPANAPSDDSAPVDITINEDDHRKVFGSDSNVPLHQPPQLTTEVEPVASAAAAWDVPNSPPPAYPDPHLDPALPDRAKSTPVGTYHLLLPTALHESGLLFNPQLTLASITPLRHTASESQTGAAVPPANAANDPNPPTDNVEPPSLADIAACKPHPEALFVAEALEWRIILDQSRVYRTPQPDLAIYDASHLYDACNLPPNSVSVFETVPTSIPAHQQTTPIRLLERWNVKSPDSPLPVLEEFNMHKCWITGKRILSSPPDTILSVIDRQLLCRFKESRENDPAVGLTGPETFIRALRVLLRVIGNYVHGERRSAPTSSVILTQKLGWDQLSRQIFLDLGWKEERMADGRNGLIPPSSSPDASPADQIVLQRHVRAWMELHVWLSFHLEALKRTKPASSVLQAPELHLATQLNVESASESILDMIGERRDHIDTTLARDLSSTTLEALFMLGVSSTTRDELVKFGYLVNLEASPKRTAELFACLDEVFATQRRTSRIIEELVAYERSLGKYSPRDLDKAYERLHLTASQLGPDVDRDSIPHDYIVGEYKARARQVLINADAAEHTAVKEALRMIADHLGMPPSLAQTLEEDVDMEVDQAYTMLDANPDLDDATLLAIFDLYVADAPARRDLLRHALRAVAEDRNSNYLRHFLKTGEKEAAATDGWQQMPSADVPAGIDNIGNTCYLNSVLQYFFSITEIRSRVLEIAASVQGGALTEDASEEGNDRRVSGQRITMRELLRSRRFVAQLAELFHKLIHDNVLSVRPERELAYLALVSSRAEELEAELNPFTEAQADEQPSASPAPPNTAAVDLRENGVTPASITESEEAMDTTTDGPTLPAETESVPTTTALSGPPPLPPRPTRKPTVDAVSGPDAAVPPPARRNSLMQLGAQQDVSECLNNCMFQLEVALAVSLDEQTVAENGMDMDESQATTGSANAAGSGDGSKEDLLSRLFLGKTCQRIEADGVAVVVDGSNDRGGRPPQPLKQPSMHIKHEVFKIVPIDVLEEGRDIYDGFDGFFDSDTFVATSGAVQRRSVTLLSAPPLLQIQLQRVQYDRTTMRAFKSQAHLDMPEVLYMDRYMDVDADDGESAARLAKREAYQDKRRQIDELRAFLAACKDGPSFTLAQTLSQAANTVEELGRLPSLAEVEKQLAEIAAEAKQGAQGVAMPASPRSRAKQIAEDGVDASMATSDDAPAEANEVAGLVDTGLAGLLRDEAKLLRERVEKAKEEIKALKEGMTEIWAGEQRYRYRLVAVFMHRGEASHGHYFLNLRGGRGDQWFKYNDSAVTKTTLDQVLRDRSGATPYLVTYVREDYTHLVDPICRQIADPVPVEDVVPGLEGWDSEPKPQMPTVVTSVIKDDDAGAGDESPIKRARTDV